MSRSSRRAPGLAGAMAAALLATGGLLAGAACKPGGGEASAGPATGEQVAEGGDKDAAKKSKRDKKKTKKKRKKGKTDADVVPVQVTRLRPGTVTRTLRFDADVKGEREVTVYSTVPERLVAIRVEEGDRVSKGQVLALVRDDALSDQLRSATAALAAARADRDALKLEVVRQRKLLARKVVAQAQVDQLEAKLEAAEAQIRRLRAMEGQAATARGNAAVRAPIAGVVGRRYMEVGDMTAPSAPLFLLVQAARVELDLEVPERDLADVRRGMDAEVRVARYPGEVFAGKVARIAPVIDRVTRTARVTVALDNGDGRLMPGMLARVDLVAEQKRGVVVVPYRALIMELGPRGETLYRVFVTKDERKANRRDINVGIIEGKKVEVTEGLALGETLVVQGQHLLEDGGRIEVVERLLPGGKVQEVLRAEEGTAKPGSGGGARATPGPAAAGEGAR